MNPRTLTALFYPAHLQAAGRLGCGQADRLTDLENARRFASSNSPGHHQRGAAEGVGARGPWQQHKSCILQRRAVERRSHLLCVVCVMVRSQLAGGIGTVHNAKSRRMWLGTVPKELCKYPGGS